MHAATHADLNAFRLAPRASVRSQATQLEIERIRSLYAIRDKIAPKLERLKASLATIKDPRREAYTRSVIVRGTDICCDGDLAAWNVLADEARRWLAADDAGKAAIEATIPDLGALWVFHNGRRN